MEMPVDYTKLDWVQRRAVREYYVAIQECNCSECGESLMGKPATYIERARINWSLFPKHFTKHPIHLHHCHKTGMTIGAVHARCNAYLWQYKGE